MSYCRFTEGDVYAYECTGGVQFYVAHGKRELDRLCNTFNEAYQYAKALRDVHGLDVPSHAIDALKADALDEVVRFTGPDGVVALLKAENANLRELVSGLHRCLGYESCDGCPMLDADGWCNRDNRLRELGIDVDGKTDATGTELLPCPFCGGEAHITTAVGESWALCDKCKASTEMYATEQSAIAAWNRRAK